jgi:4'-phosphopantetheinyl transferase
MSRAVHTVWMPPENDQARPVGLWLLPIENAGIAAGPRLMRLLSPWERSRLERLRLEADRARYIAAHALVRVALSETEPAPPDEWRLEQTQSGKPFVPGRGIEFSLSHTRGLVGCAVARAPVGLDLEFLDRHLAIDDLLPQVMAAGELARWHERACRNEARRFLSYWTLKEASAKALGFGMGVPLSSLSFDVGDSGEATITALPAAFGDARRWSVRLFDWAGTHVGAVALQSGSMELHIRPLEIDALIGAIE